MSITGTQPTHAQLQWREALRRIWERQLRIYPYQAVGSEVQLHGYIWRLQLYMAKHFERRK
jgi:hypothetical protein